MTIGPGARGPVEGRQRDEPTDEALFAQVQAGRRDALGVLFDRHYDGLFRLAVRLLGDADAAADAVQDAFVRMLRYRHAWRGRGAWRPWLYAIARNACLDLLNASRRERDALARASVEWTPVPSDRDPAARDRVERLERALAGLRSGRREALVLRRFHGFSYREIGEICGISEGAARVRVHRALEDLRRFFGLESEAST